MSISPEVRSEEAATDVVIQGIFQTGVLTLFAGIVGRKDMQHPAVLPRSPTLIRCR